MIGETAWIEPSASPDSAYAIDNFLKRAYVPPDSPLFYSLWWPRSGEDFADLCWTALRFTAAAVIVGSIGWCLRRRLNAGWLAIVAIVIACMVTLGPIRLAEAMTFERSHLPPIRLINQ